MSVRQAPGWWPNLVQFVCDNRGCQYVGPTRDMYQDRSKWMLREDERVHVQECHA